MKNRLFVVAVLLSMLGLFCSFSTVALANDDYEDYYVREEAARRDMVLISVEQAKSIAARRIGSNHVRFKDVDLEDEGDDYPSRDGFRPVWKFECVSGGMEYDIDIDAVTGQVLKFRIDD